MRTAGALSPAINRERLMKLQFLAALPLAVFAPAAWAYVGPGLGAGAMAAVLGVLFGVLMLVIGVVWYPLKRLLRRLRAKR